MTKAQSEHLPLPGLFLALGALSLVLAYVAVC
jgi:hypothetical protein